MERHITCSLCEALCGLKVTVEGGEVTDIRGNPDDVLSRGHVCPKAVALKDLHADPDRLRQPMRRTAGGWEPISWREAMTLAGDRLHAITRAHGPDAVALYVGNPMAHNYGGALAMQLLGQVLGTRNRASATSTDQLPHMFAAWHMFGHQLMMPVPDVDRADLMIMLGANPLVSGGSIMTAPGMGRRLKAIQARGGRVVVIDPRRTRTAEVADEHHFIRPGADALLLLAMLRTLFEERLVVQGPWQSWSRGLETLEAVSQGFTPEAVASATGIEAQTTRELARALARTPAAVLYGRFGVCTQEFGGLCAWLLLALNAVTGHLDSPGGLMFTRPAMDLVTIASMVDQRGHFDRWRSRVRGMPEFGGEIPVATLADEMLTPGSGQVRALITLAGNPALSAPDGPRMEAGLAGLEFMVAVDYFINETTRHADLILPPLSPLERDHYGLVFHALAVRNTVKYSPPLLPPQGKTRSDWAIILGLSRALLRRRGPQGTALALAAGVLEGLGSRVVLDLGLRLGPYGTLRGGKLNLARVEEARDGIDLGALTPALPDLLQTEDGRVELAPRPMIADLARLRRAWTQGRWGVGGLVLIGRRQLRSNNSWLHNSPRLVRGAPRCTLLLHPQDAAARGVEDGQEVRVQTRVGSVQATARLDDGLMPGVVSLPHGWGHHRPGTALSVASAHAGVSLNDLTDALRVDQLTGTAAFSGVPVEVESATPR